MHFRFAHRAEAEARIVTTRVKPRWSDEDVRRMATAEAHAIHFSLGDNINQYLQRVLFKDRTTESIKGKRREAAYKALVKSRLESLEAEDVESMTDSDSSSSRNSSSN